MSSQLRRKRSVEWEHFEEKGDGKTATCKTCKTNLKYVGNPTNLKKHLQAMHPTLILKPEEKEESSPSTTKQPKLDFTAKYPPSAKRRHLLNLLNHKLVRMITKSILPVSFVESESFRDLMETADPKYELPSRRTFMRDLNDEYEAALAETKGEINAAKHVCLTTDIWSSRAGHGYLGVTAHTLQNWETKTYNIACEHFSEDHTGANIAKHLMDIASRWDITQKTTLVVTDSAASMLLGMKMVPWTGVPCLAHLLHLVVTDALRADTEVTDVIKKAKEVTSYFHHSPKALTRLDGVQVAMDLSRHALIQEVPTRWNSALDMLQRLIEQFDAVNSVLGQLDRARLCLSQNDLQIMKEVVVNLAPFKVLTETLCGEKYATMSSAIPLIRGVKHMLSQVDTGRKTLQEELKTQTAKRFGKIEDQERLANATLLDPRYKKAVFTDPARAKKHTDVLQKEIADRLAKVVAKHKQKEPEASTSAASEETESRNKLLDYIDSLDDVHTQATLAFTSQAIVEMTNYMNEPRLERRGDPLEFWKDNADRFPNVSALAKKYLCAPATSVPCERLFSTAGEIVSDKRAKLKPDNVEKLLFLNKNLK